MIGVEEKRNAASGANKRQKRILETERDAVDYVDDNVFIQVGNSYNDSNVDASEKGDVQVSQKTVV